MTEFIPETSILSGAVTISASYDEPEKQTKLTPVKLDAYFRRTALKLTYDQTGEEVNTEKAAVRYLSHAEIQQLLAGDDILTITGKSEINLINKKEILDDNFSWSRWFVFLSREDKNTDKLNVIAIPDVDRDDPYGYSPRYMSFNGFKELVHEYKNDTLDDYRENIANPVPYILKKMLSSDFDSDVDQDILKAAKETGEVSVSDLMKLADASHKVLKIDFE